VGWYLHDQCSCASHLRGKKVNLVNILPGKGGREGAGEGKKEAEEEEEKEEEEEEEEEE